MGRIRSASALLLPGILVLIVDHRDTEKEVFIATRFKDSRLNPSNHSPRILEWFGSEGTLSITQFQLPCHGQRPLPPAQGAQSSIQPGLEHCQGGDSHSFSRQPGQGLTTLIGKNFFAISNPNLPSFSLKPSPLVLSLHALVKSPSPALLLWLKMM